MVKMTMNLMNALKATLIRVASRLPNGVLICGFDKSNKKSFCQMVKLQKNIAKLISCTELDIKGIGFYPAADAKMVSWLKVHIRTPADISFCNSLLSPSNWLKYNVAEDISMLHLSIAKKEYFMFLKSDNLNYFRTIAFNKK